MNKLRPSGRAILATVTLVGGLSLSAHAATNVLSNPGFETGNLNGWTGYGNCPVESTNNTYYNGGLPGGSNVLTHSGAYVGKTYGSFTGGYNVNGVYADAVAGPGSLWSAGGFALTHQQDLIQAGNQFWLELTFRDVTDTIIGMYRSAIVDPQVQAPVSNVWQNFQVTNQYDVSDLSWSTITNTGTVFTAPAGTVKARFQVVYAQLTGYPGGSMYFDDLNLTKVAGSDPDISVNPVSQKKVEGQTVTFTVVATGGSALSYQWQKDELDLGDDTRITGSSTPTLTITNLSALDNGKYRVVVTDNAGSAYSAPATLEVVTAAQASNILDNRGFEAGTDAPWIRFGGGGLVNSLAEGVYDGVWVSESWGNGAGSWNGLYQDRPVTPGQGFTAEGWFLVSVGVPFTGASEAFMEAQFQNASGNMMALYRSDMITSNTPYTGLWTKLAPTHVTAFWGDYSTVSEAPYMIAPPGAARIRVQINYHARDGGGAIFYDDISLFLKIPVTVTLVKSGANINLSFPTQLGVNYQVVYKNNLTDADWTVLAPVTGDGTVKTVSDSAGPPNRFYRVKTL